MRLAWRKVWLTPVLVATLGGAIMGGLANGNVSDDTARKWRGSHEMVSCDLPIRSASCDEDTKGWEGSSEDDRTKA